MSRKFTVEKEDNRDLLPAPIQVFRATSRQDNAYKRTYITRSAEIIIQFPALQRRACALAVCADDVFSLDKFSPALNNTPCALCDEICHIVQSHAVREL